jgi:hypothetical protein
VLYALKISKEENLPLTFRSKKITKDAHRTGLPKHQNKSGYINI